MCLINGILSQFSPKTPLLVEVVASTIGHINLRAPLFVGTPYLRVVPTLVHRQ